MYELFLLGKLLERPWYGYEFQQALSGFAGPHRKVSWGTVYPLFQRLERGGLIRPVLQRGPKGGRDKQAFAITPAGKRRFRELMDKEREDDPQFRETFRIKVGHFSRVRPEVRKRIVDHYVERLAAMKEHTKNTAQTVRHIPAMPEEERNLILCAISHEQFLLDAEIEWVKKKIALLTACKAVAPLSRNQAAAR